MPSILDHIITWFMQFRLVKRMINPDKLKQARVDVAKMLDTAPKAAKIAAKNLAAYDTPKK